MNTLYFKQLIMGNLFGTSNNPKIPTEYWIGLSSTLPTSESNGGISGAKEPPTSGTGYKRVRLDNMLSAPASGVITNKTDISFNESFASWGTVSYYVVFDAQTAGNLLFYGSLTPAIEVKPGTTVTIKRNELKIELIEPSNS